MSRVAAGKLPFGRAIAEANKLYRKSDLVGGNADLGAWVVPLGDDVPDLSGFDLPGGARYVVVGDAVGDLGRKDGLQYTVLVVAVSGQAK